MRATIHNARTGKDGAFSSRHNDRNFESSNAEHITLERSRKNFYWHCMLPECPELTFEEVEKKFYETHFRDHLDSQNARYAAQRHHERVKSMDEYRTAPQTCPEETLLMIGKKGDSISPQMLKNICTELIAWEEMTFPGVHVLNIALHVDEEGAPHLHERKIWLYRDKNGHEAVGQNKVLESLDVSLPHPDKICSRYNNRKQTYSRMLREKFLQICKRHGLEIDEKPRDSSQSGRMLADYKARKAEERANKLHLFAVEQIKEIGNLQEEINNLQQDEKRLLSQLHKKNMELDVMEKQVLELRNYMHLAEQRRSFEILYSREHERTR